MSKTNNNVRALARSSTALDRHVAVPAPAEEEVSQASTETPLVATLKRRWGLVLSMWLLLAGGLCAFIWTYFHTEYEAVGLVRVAPSIRPVLFRDEESGIMPFYTAFLSGQMQSITGNAVLTKAVESQEVREMAWVSQVEDPAAYLADELEVDNPENSELISVALKGPDPSQLAPVVNAVLRAYHEKVTAENESDDTAQLKLLYAEQAKLEEELKKQHNDLYGFANEVGSLSLGDQKDAAFAGIQTVQIELKKAQAERVAAEAHLAALKKRGPAPLSEAEWDQLQQYSLMVDSELSALGLARQADEQRLLQMAQQLGPDHRELKNTRERVDQLNRKITDRRNQLAQTVASLAEVRARTGFEVELKKAEQVFLEASQKEKALEAVVRDDLAMLGTMGKNAVQLQALKEKADLTKQLHNQVLQRIQHLEVEKQRPARVTIDTWASEPTSPAKDKRPKLTILAVVAGLFMAMTLAVLVDSRDTFVRSEEDIRRTVGLTVLGTRTIPKRRQFTNKDVLATVAEEIRGIRGCVLFAGDTQDFRSLLITSPNPQEGKTHTAGELAVALAESGRRVLLIDADNRKRDLSHQLGAADRPGLTDVLENGKDPEQLILTTSTSGLSFLPAGPVCDAFSELLVRPGQLERLCRLFERYDLVLVDSPPVLLSNDACIWARFIDSVLMVLRVKHSAREEALAAKEKLNLMGGRIMGAVLNGVEHRPSYYSRYAYAEA